MVRFQRSCGCSPSVATPPTGARRYLCAVEPTYRQQLSPPSFLSLRLQGGPMTDEEVRWFRESPHFAAAVALRRWDDVAKDPAAIVPGLDACIPFIAKALASSAGSQRVGS